MENKPTENNPMNNISDETTLENTVIEEQAIEKNEEKLAVSEDVKEDNISSDTLSKEEAPQDVGIAAILKRKADRSNKRKRLFLVLLGLVVVIVLAAIIVVNSKSGKVTVEIPEGTSTTQIAEILKENDVIESKYLFLIRLKFSDYHGKLQYGTFTFDKSDSFDEIAKTLATKGAKKSTVTVTIPEGYSVERIKARIVEAGLCSDSEFEDALKKEYDYPFLKANVNNKNVNYELQGFLYPSTYEFYSDATAEDIINTMLGEFQKQTKDLGIEDYHTIITLASLVEREAKLDSERELIAGVMRNRIVINMPLQIDATVVYAISDGMYDVDRVYYKDLEVDSPYNTYKYAGLPAGPICSPSLKSIKAAISPDNHSYLFYHTDTEKNDGSHIFTETFSQHKETMN